MQEGFAYACCCGNVAPFTLRAKLRTEQHIQVGLFSFYFDKELVIVCFVCLIVCFWEILQASEREDPPPPPPTQYPCASIQLPTHQYTNPPTHLIRRKRITQLYDRIVIP